MSKVRFLWKAAFVPETIALLASAFGIAGTPSKKSGSPLAPDDQAASIREVIAKRRARLRERNPRRLVADALAHLARSK